MINQEILDLALEAYDLNKSYYMEILKMSQSCENLIDKIKDDKEIYDSDVKTYDLESMREDKDKLYKYALEVCKGDNDLLSLYKRLAVSIRVEDYMLSEKIKEEIKTYMNKQQYLFW